MLAEKFGKNCGKKKAETQQNNLLGNFALLQSLAEQNKAEKIGDIYQNNLLTTQNLLSSFSNQYHLISVLEKTKYSKFFRERPNIQENEFSK